MAKENSNTLLTIYGCKVSKDNKRLVLTLVRGEDEDKQYYSACIKLDGTQKTKASISKDKKYGLVKIEMLKEELDDASLQGTDPYLGNIVMTANYILGRKKSELAGEDEDLFIPASGALAGRMSNTEETVIAQAPDPTRQTKPSTPKSDDKGKNDNKGNNAKDSKNDKGTNKTEPKKQEGKDNKDNKDNKPKADSKPDSKDDNVIHRPVRPVLKDQGKEAAKGHYIQVGIFSKDSKIDPIFLNNISKYSYRIKAVDGDKVRYLIGPYNSKTDANRELQTIRTEINSGAFYFLVN